MKCKFPPRIAILLFCGVIVFGQSTPPPTENEKKTQPPPAASAAVGPVEVLNDRQGVNFRPYLQVVVRNVRTN
jgi:hypothetical protein